MFFLLRMKTLHSLCNQHPIPNSVDKQIDHLETHSIVTNFSHYKLSEEHCKLLKHGYSFCPAKKHIDRIKICYDNERCCRNIRLHEHFPSTTKISKGVGVLSRLSKELSYNIMILIYSTILLPYLTYCRITWGFTYQTYINKIFTIQKRQFA